MAVRITASPPNTLIDLINTYNSLYNSYNKKIDIVTYHPEVFKNNIYVNNIFEFSSFDLTQTSYKEKFETFLGVGGVKNNLGVEKKHNTIDIRQFHAIDLGFMLKDDEMQYDFISDDYINIDNLPEKYVCIHAANTWPSRTYSDEKFTQLIDDLNKNNIQLQFIGDLSTLPPHASAALEQATADTASNTGLKLIIALSYSSRWELVHAAQTIAQQVKNGQLDPAQIDEAIFAQNLTTKGIPDPELMIRTSGQHRISNFLLYQLAYAELYFTETRWPDFRKEHLLEAIMDYQSRERRFGKTSAQIQSNE